MCGTRAARTRVGCGEGAWLRPSAMPPPPRGQPAGGREGIGKARESPGCSGRLGEGRVRLF